MGLRVSTVISTSLLSTHAHVCVCDLWAVLEVLCVACRKAIAGPSARQFELDDGVEGGYQRHRK